MKDIGMAALQVFLLSASLLGYIAFSRAYLRVPDRASYLFSFSLIACIVYLGGLVGQLALTAQVLYAAGFAMLVLCLLKKALPKAFKRSLCLLNLIFLVCTVMALVTLSGYSLIHYDNFSHWALVVKYMLMNHQFPDAAAAIIDFKSYPTGTASFLYYVCRVVGHTEGAMLAAQCMLIVACFYAIFGVIRDYRRFMLVALLGMGLNFLAYYNIGIRINNLLVDFVLPLYALGAIGCICSCRGNVPLACLCAAPVMGMLTIIKSTGLFFWVPCVAFLFSMWFQNRRKYTMTLPYVVAVVLATLAIWVVWQVHASIEFAGQTYKFALDFGNLDSFAIDKTPEDIRTIVQLFVQTTFSSDQLPSRGIVLFNVLVLLLYFNARVNFGKHFHLLRILLLLDLMIVIYYVGILLMFIFTMRLDEALRLAGFDRYTSSIVMFFIGALSMSLTANVENALYVQLGERRDARAFKTLRTKQYYQYASMAFACIGTLMIFTELEGMNNLQLTYDQTLPGKLSEVIEDNWTGSDARRYLIYAPDTDGQVTDDYVQYVSRYRLFAANTDEISEVTDVCLTDNLNTYNQLIVAEMDEDIAAWLQAHGMSPQVGHYAVSALTQGVQQQEETQ